MNKAPSGTAGTANVPNGTHSTPACAICTIHLEMLCYQRAWWFRAFREVLATGIRLFALAYGIRRFAHPPRSPRCHGCLRFRKNVLKERSRLFAWLDSYLNPLFNRVRNALLTEEELDRARTMAKRLEDPAQRDFV